MAVDLAKISAAAQVSEEARMDLHYLIRKARDSGESLRAISRAAGMSHEQVRRICAK